MSYPFLHYTKKGYQFNWLDLKYTENIQLASINTTLMQFHKRHIISMVTSSTIPGPPNLKDLNFMDSKHNLAGDSLKFAEFTDSTKLSSSVNSLWSIASAITTMAPGEGW
jgi:hypothetical protein